MKENNKYAWHGEPVKTVFGLASVQKNDEYPLYWYNYEVSLENSGDRTISVVPAIKVILKDSEPFFIANHFGIGEYKLKQGGWPNCSHFSIPSDCTFKKLDSIELGEFDEENYAKHEAARKRWQKINFPIEFEQSEQLRKLANKNRIWKSLDI